MKTIYFNGNIITMDKENPIVQAIYIENGRIIKIGNNDEILRFKDETTTLVDLDHKTMLPGFMDGHSHFVALANSLSQCDLSETKSFDDIINAMKQFIKDNNIQPGEWVSGVSYDQNFLVEKQHPNRHVLDEISKDYPIVIVHASSHMGVANTLALEKAGLVGEIADPDGGKYGREDDSNKLNGYMEENAFMQFQTKMPMIAPEKLLELMVKAQDIYASNGITTIQDGFVSADLYQLLQYAAKLNLLKLDVIGYIDLNNSRDLYKQLEDPHAYMNHLKIGGYKIFLDGSPQGKTAWMLEPYEGEKEYCGYPVLTDERLNELITMALEDKAQLLAHCNGDAAANQYIEQFEKAIAKKEDKETYRPVMIHAQLVHDSQLKRMADLKMIPSFFVAHTYFWGDIHLNNFGQQRGSHISPAKTAVDLNMPFTFHQDTPVLPPNMLQTVWCAVNRITRTGVSIGKDQCISVDDALKAITLNTAYQYYEEDIKGSISEGKLADLVILDKNPYECDKDSIKDIIVLETIKEGKTIYKK